MRTTHGQPEPLIRAAAAADVPTLGQLRALLVQKHEDFDPRRFIRVESTSTHYGAFLGEQVDDPNALVLVAEQDGIVIGYAYAAIEGYEHGAAWARGRSSRRDRRSRLS